MATGGERDGVQSYDELVKTIRYQVCTYRQSVSEQRNDINRLFRNGLPELTGHFQDRITRIERTRTAMVALDELAELAGLTIDCAGFDPAVD